MSKELKSVTFSITPESHEKLRKLASAKRVSVPGLVWNLVMEAIEDEEDIREGMKPLADEKGTISLEEFKRQIEEKL